MFKVNLHIKLVIGVAPHPPGEESAGYLNRVGCGMAGLCLKLAFQCCLQTCCFFLTDILRIKKLVWLTSECPSCDVMSVFKQAI